MKLNTGVNSAFPDQMVSEEEKKIFRIWFVSRASY